MADYPIIICNICPYTEMHVIIHNLRLSPLLQFYNNDIILSTIICSDNDKINALRCLRNIVLDSNLDAIVNFVVINDIPHELHGILPCRKFTIPTGIQASPTDKVKNLCCNDIRPNILDELSFVGTVDYHITYNSLIPSFLR